MDDDPTASRAVNPDAPRPVDQPPAEHPAGHEDEVLLDSPEQAAALLAEMEGAGGSDGSDGAPWTDGPDHAAAEGLPEPASSGPAREAEPAGADEPVLPMSVEGVGDLVADPLSRAKVLARDDPGGPAPEEVPPSPS